MTGNTVELIGYYGSDLTHAQSAWTSTHRDLTKDKLNRVDKLLTMLATEGHLTPFEKSSIHFLVNTDIATHIHLLKHRIGVSINTESARYKELKDDKYYIPQDMVDVKTTDYIWFDERSDDATYLESESWSHILEEYTKLGNELYHKCLADMSNKLGRKRAKESARFFKTYNSQITADIMFNWRSFAHFQKLRNSEHSQKEVRELAQEMLRLTEETGEFKFTIAALREADYLP